MTKWKIIWNELKSAIVEAKNKEDAEWEATQNPNTDVLHEDIEILSIKKLKKVI
jgi:hypothetical protein